MLGIEIYRASFARCLFLLHKKEENSCLKKCRVKINLQGCRYNEHFPERSWDLLLLKYQYDYNNDSLADLMGIPEYEVETAINHVHLSIAAALLLLNSRPMGEDILQRAVTIVMYRQMDNMPEIESVEETYVAKQFNVFMQKLEERYEKRMREKANV